MEDYTAIVEVLKMETYLLLTKTGSAVLSDENLLTVLGLGEHSLSVTHFKENKIL